MLDDCSDERYHLPMVFQGYLAEPICDLCDIRDETVRKRPCEMELCNDCAQKYLKRKKAP